MLLLRPLATWLPRTRPVFSSQLRAALARPTISISRNLHLSIARNEDFKIPASLDRIGKLNTNSKDDTTLLDVLVADAKEDFTDRRSAFTKDGNIFLEPIDSQDAGQIQQLRLVNEFLLELWADQAETNAYHTPVKDVETCIRKITESWLLKFPALPPPSPIDVIKGFHLYFALSHEIVFVDQLKFSDPQIQKLQASIIDLLDKPLETAAQTALEETGVSPETAKDLLQVFYSWNNIPVDRYDLQFSVLCDFDKLASSPYKFSFKAEDSGRSEQLEKEWQQWKQMRSSRRGPELDAWNHQPQGEKKDPKNGDKKKDNKKEYFVDINLTSPNARYFQLGLLGGLTLYIIYSMTQEGDQEISFQEFTANFLRKNLVEKVHVINNKTAVVVLNGNGKAQYPHSRDFYFNIGSVESFERNLKAVQEENNTPELLRVPVVFATEGNMAKVLVNFLPTLLFLGAIYYMTKKANIGGMGGPLGFGKSKAKKFNQETDIDIGFKDVAGMSEAKEEVEEFVKFLKNPGKYEKLGAKIPRGAILSGPPGTGKTMIARATAGEAGVPFYSVSGSEFIEMFVGVGASRVRDLFKTARENAPSIVFVDEIDAIGKQRAKGNASGANDERETTLNQLLVEMDGFESSDHVVVLAGTNRPDILDKALMRPGRFDRHIAIDNPELQGRKEIFDVHLKKITIVENIDKDLSGRLAALTPGFSGADIANVCNEAALIAARYNAKAVTMRHFELAIERVIGGVEKKSKVLDPLEKKIVAYHEAGHAVCGWFLKYAHPLLKVSIIPRGQGALGYAQYLPPDQYLMSTLQLYDQMVMTFGGRVSEELHFDSVTSGAHDDFKKVTNIAQSMVMRFGMSPKVGMVNYADTREQDDFTKPFSDETNTIIDLEIKRIVKECYDECKRLLSEKADAVEKVAQELLRKEYITREDMIRLLGKRPFPERNDAFDKYLEDKPAFKNEKPADEKKDGE